MQEDPPFRTGCIIGDRLIVLDRHTSRYFSVAHDPLAASSVPDTPAHQSAVLSWSDERSPNRNNARVSWVTLPRSAVEVDEYPRARLALAQLWLRERAIGRRLRAGIEAGLRPLLETVLGDADPRGQDTMIGTAWRSRRLWSADDRCLPRSIALTMLLRQRGSSARLVVGVTAQPFGAHAWVQEDDVVLNDTLDHAALFTPIFVA